MTPCAKKMTPVAKKKMSPVAKKNDTPRIKKKLVYFYLNNIKFKR